MWVAPFGYLRIDACLPLPEAFRSLPRPSSASGAKAFPLRPFVLNLLTVIMWVLFAKRSYLFSRSTKLQYFYPKTEKLVCSLLKYFFCLALLLFVLLIHIVQFSRYIFGLLKLSAFASCLFALHPLPLLKKRMSGGLKWTRTIDLALIRRAL